MKRLPALRAYGIVLLLGVLLGACAGVPVDKKTSGELGYQYRPWLVDTKLDKICAIPQAASANPDNPEQRGLRLVRGIFVNAAILHYGVSRIERYSDSRKADAVALVATAQDAAEALATAWKQRSEPSLYELRKADIVRNTAAMAARAVDPAMAKLRAYAINPMNMNAASELIVGALETAIYSKAYLNDCNRLMHSIEITKSDRTKTINDVAKLYAHQMLVECQRAAQLGGQSDGCSQETALEGLFNGP